MDTTLLTAYGPTVAQQAVLLLMGLGLAACCGLRAFLPLLCINLLSLTEFVELGSGYSFMGSWAATLVFGVAAVTEWIGDKFPGFDHLMDSAGMIIRPTAATVAAASMIHWMDPLAATALGLMAGGIAAGSVQVIKAKVRVASSMVTAGFGNIALSFGEDIAAVGTIAATILAPVALLMVVFIVGAVWWAVQSWKGRHLESVACV